MHKSALSRQEDCLLVWLTSASHVSLRKVSLAFHPSTWRPLTAVTAPTSFFSTPCSRATSMQSDSWAVSQTDAHLAASSQRLHTVLRFICANLRESVYARETGLRKAVNSVLIKETPMLSDSWAVRQTHTELLCQNNNNLNSCHHTFLIHIAAQGRTPVCQMARLLDKQTNVTKKLL